MEQRRAKRFDLKLPFELIRRGCQSLSQHGETQNLRPMGVLFQTPTNNLRIGEPVEYIITLPTTPGSEEQVRLHCLGKIVRHARETGIAATLERYEFVR